MASKTVTANKLMKMMAKADVAIVMPHSRNSFFALKKEVQYVKPTEEDVLRLIKWLKVQQADWMNNKPNVYMLSRRLGDWLARAEEDENGESEDYGDLVR